MHRLSFIAFAALLIGCQQAAEPPAPAPSAPESTETAAPAPAPPSASERLAAVLAAQPEEVQSRYVHRHPQETLEFFGIEPGMTVLEGLPGAGWYTKLLLPYLGSEGHLIGANYALEVFPLFGFFSEERIAQMQTWVTDWPAGAEEWRGPDGATVAAFHFGSMPEEIAGTADAVLHIRVLHNLARFQGEGKGNFLDAALADSYRALKPGGILGIVQHEARPEMPDDWANGSRGYLKKSFVVEQVEAAGFEFVAESDVNANDKDRPTADDVVWRLPPTLATSREDPELKAQYEAIGESNRMTLKFRKPN